uniref:Calponin-homology (CH) domain-containing protein n=1 Tax=Haptolina ericina TaxID=156174 RepID=A0A7S3EXS5_9EUKA
MAVLINLQALGRAAQKVPGYSGPTFGAKAADANVREFTEEQRIAGAATTTFLGKGSCGGATQAGMTDTSRNIVKPVEGGAAPVAAGGITSGMASVGLANQSTECKSSYAQGGGGGTFTTYEQRAAEAGGGEVNYGLSKELAEKAAAKYDPALEAATRKWIEEVTGEKLGEMSLQQELKNGVVLCTLINCISSGVCPKPSTAKMPFKQMENIANYLAACEKLNVAKHDQFQTVALYEDKDMMAVLINLQALGRAAQKVPGYSGPTFGAKAADANVREFTEEQLKAGLTEQTFLGKGSHGHANQSGMFDTSKEIVKSADAGSSAPTMMGMGSHGQASQAGMTDTSRNIVKPGCG